MYDFNENYSYPYYANIGMLRNYTEDNDRVFDKEKFRVLKKNFILHLEHYNSARNTALKDLYSICSEFGVDAISKDEEIAKIKEVNSPIKALIDYYTNKWFSN